MATIHTLIDYDRQNPTAISREQYTDVGADAFSPGTFPRAFNDLEVWDAATAGNQLVIDIDYELVDVDLELSSANYEDEAVYKTLRIINATYQVGSIWLTYEAIGTYATALLHDPSELPAAGALDGTEPIATVQSGEMVKATPAQIDAYVRGLAEMITVKSGNYTILDDNLNVYEFSGASGDGTFIGPTLADNLGRVLEIHNADPTYKLTFDPEGAETVDGNASVVLPSQYNYLKVRAGTAGWHVLGMKANHDTGWVNQADITDLTVTVTHNLGVTVDQLTCEVTWATDSAGADSMKPASGMYDAASAASKHYATGIVGSSADAIVLQTGFHGIAQLVASGYWAGKPDTFDYYRVVITRIK